MKAIQTKHIGPSNRFPETLIKAWVDCASISRPRDALESYGQDPERVAALLLSLKLGWGWKYHDFVSGGLPDGSTAHVHRSAE